MIFPEEKEKWLCTTLELLKLMQIYGYVQIAANIKLKVSFPYQAKMLRHNIYIIEKKISGSKDSIHACFRSLKFV